MAYGYRRKSYGRGRRISYKQKYFRLLKKIKRRGRSGGRRRYRVGGMYRY